MQKEHHNSATIEGTIEGTIDVKKPARLRLHELVHQVGVSNAAQPASIGHNCRQLTEEELRTIRKIDRSSE